LNGIKVSDNVLSANDLKALNVAFPNVVVITDGRSRAIPGEVFAPLH
jgi:hypothetical protein